MARVSIAALVVIAALGWPTRLPADTGPAEPAGARGLHVIPFPGTPDASRLSSIIFSSLRPSDVVSVVVTGSRSGVHPGRLAALPDGAGTAFVPTTPFTDGEHVAVIAR